VNLEAVERRCLSYLEQVSNPLARFTSLLQRIREDEDCGAVSENELLDFLRNHELFRVIEPPQFAQDPRDLDALPEAGVGGGPRVILETRIPTKAQMSAMVREQVANVVDALSKAFAEARRTQDPEMCDKLLDALARAEKLQKKVNELM